MARASFVEAISLQINERVRLESGTVGRVAGFTHQPKRPSLLRSISDDESVEVVASVEIIDSTGRTWLIPGHAEVTKLEDVDLGVSAECVDLIQRWGLGFQLGTAVHNIVTSSLLVPEKRIENLQRARLFIDREIERLTHERR